MDNETYEVIPCAGLEGWWNVTYDGVPVRLFAPNKRDLAERYCTDPQYRASLGERKYHDKK